MPESKPNALTRIEPEDSLEHSRAQACNRILLYGRGMDLSSESCLGLAGESLRRAPRDGGMEAILSEMHAILEERGMDPALAGAAGGQPPSAPPLHRTPMVSRGEDCRSFLGWVGCNLVLLAKALSPWGTAWKRRKT